MAIPIIVNVMHVIFITAIQKIKLILRTIPVPLIYLLIFLNGTVLCSSLFAQQKKPATDREMKKRIMDMKKKMGAGKGFDKKELEALAKQFGAQVKNGKTTFPSTQKANVFTKIYIGDLPRKPLVGQELRGYVTGLEKKVLAKMAKEDLEIVNDVMEFAGNDSRKLAELSVFAFYKGGAATGIVLAMKVVLMDVENGLNVNNLGGMLITAGAPAQAIPIFRGLVMKNSKNAMMLNNMAQAFAGVGLKDSAMVYIGRCVKQSPKHAQANNTAAQIAKSNGNTAKALELAKISVEGGLNAGAMDIIKQFDKSGNAYDFLAKQKDIPDYFNQYKFKKPSHQVKVEDAEKVRVEQKEFTAQIDEMTAELSALANSESKLGNLALDQTVKEAYTHTLATGQAPTPLMSSLVIQASRVFPNAYIQRELVQKMQQAEMRYRATISQERQMLDLDLQKIDNKFKEMMAKYECVEGKGSGCMMIEALSKQSCKEKDERINIYLESCAMAADGFDKIQLQAARERFHFNSKWQYLVGLNEHLANSEYYSAAIKYLNEIRKVVGYPIVTPVCNQLDKELRQQRERAKFAYACPVNLNMELGVASIKANCKELSWTIKAPEGLKFNFKKNFETGQSTLSLIAFIDGSLGIGNSKGSTPGTAVAVKGELYEAFYVTFDKNNSFADAGLRSGAQLSLVASSGIKGEGAATTIEKGFETSFGINSGFKGEAKGMDGIGDSIMGSADQTIGSWFN